MRPFAENKKAYFNYRILEKFDAGIALIGQEVKSVKLGRANLAGSYVILKNDEVFLAGCSIPPYQPKNAPQDYNPERSRKLLLTKAEIKYLIGKSRQKGLTLLPLKLYPKGGKIKLEFGIAKGLKKVDKRDLIKKRETQREIDKELKSRG